MNLSDRALRRIAWASFGVFLAAAWGDTLVELADDRWDGGLSTVVGTVTFALVITLFPAVGLLVTLQQPHNRVAWLLHAVGWAFAVSGFLNSYATIAMSLSPGALPGGEVVNVLSSAMWVPAFTVMGVFLILLFPDGRLPSPRWRALPWVAAVVTVMFVAAGILVPGPVADAPVPLDDNPLAVAGTGAVVSAVSTVTFLAFVGCVLASAVALVLRFRRARGVDRMQLKWLMATGTFVTILFAVTMTVSLLPGVGDADDPGWLSVLPAAVILSFGLLPVSIGIAITRHGLFGIDALISRALMVGALGVFITLVYVGIVVGLGRADRPTPARRCSSPWSRRHWSRWRSSRCAGACSGGSTGWSTAPAPRPTRCSRTSPPGWPGSYTTRELLPRLAQTLSDCLGGAQVGIWLQSGRELTREGAWPGATGTRLVDVADDRPHEALSADRVVPVLHRGEVLGAITVDRGSTEPVTPAEDSLLGQVASQTGLVLRNLRLVEDLQSSQAAPRHLRRRRAAAPRAQPA